MRFPVWRKNATQFVEGNRELQKTQESATATKAKHEKGEGALLLLCKTHSTRHLASILHDFKAVVTDIEDETNTAELGLGRLHGQFGGWVVSCMQDSGRGTKCVTPVRGHWTEISE